MAEQQAAQLACALPSASRAMPWPLPAWLLPDNPAMLSCWTADPFSAHTPTLALPPLSDSFHRQHCRLVAHLLPFVT